MSEFVPPNEQLVVEVYVRDLAASKAFYLGLGFQFVREEPGFAVVQWENTELLLDEVGGIPKPPARPVANVRVMVPDVDAYWERVQALNIPVLVPIRNREYGLRDFTIYTPDGIGLRFATPI